MPRVRRVIRIKAVGKNKPVVKSKPIKLLKDATDDEIVDEIAKHVDIDTGRSESIDRGVALSQRRSAASVLEKSNCTGRYGNLFIERFANDDTVRFTLPISITIDSRTINKGIKLSDIGAMSEEIRNEFVQALKKLFGKNVTPVY